MFRRTLKLFHVSIHTTTFYKKPLPEPLIAFSSPQGKQLFREALEQGGMEGYFQLAEQYHTQSEPAFCGLGTLAMVLNALQMDPGRMWKAPWRWFSEEMFDCCVSLDSAKAQGITLEQFWCLAKCNGADVRLLRYERSSEQEFRKYIEEATHQANFHMVSSFSRAALGQTGDGHFSPIGGYHKQKDLVLLMDVARFKYPSYWLPVSTLWRAMGELDETTKRPRGYLLLKASNRVSFIYKLFLSHKMTWRNMVLTLMQVIPEHIDKRNAELLSPTPQCQQEKEHQLTQQEQTIDHTNGATGEDNSVALVEKKLCDAVRVIFTHMPPSLESELVSYSHTLLSETTSCEEHKNKVVQLLLDLSSIRLFSLVHRVFHEEAVAKLLHRVNHNGERLAENGRPTDSFLLSPKAAELATMLLLALPLQAFHGLEPLVLQLLRTYREPVHFASIILREEISHMRFQLRELCDMCGSECDFQPQKM